jgi:hypothetical protein
LDRARGEKQYQPYRSFIARIGAIKASVAAFDPISGQSPIAIP